MGCFLACFGSSKDRRRKEQRIRSAQPRVQRCPSFKPVHVELPVSLEQVSVEIAVDPAHELQCKVEPVHESQCKDEPVEEQLSSNIRKTVTFDSNVKTYEHVEVSCDEAPDSAPETNNGVKEGCSLGEPTKSLPFSGDSVKSTTQTQASSEGSSVTSIGSYPPSHRYQNCRESDDDGEDDMEFGMSDIDDDDDEDDDGLSEDGDEIVDDRAITDTLCDLSEEKVKLSPIGSKPSTRDRSHHLHPVLNPVENLSQWKEVKAKGKPQPKPQKENLTSDQEPEFKELSLSFSFNPKRSQPKSSGSDMAVDTSLSNWLISPEKTKSPGSNSFTSREDRPILCALTVEDMKHLSATSSPRKSPSRSPDDTPIIGTVGTYWSSNNNTGSTKDCSGSPSSFKGIPNTTSKYREEKKVNWHSTPFETRLERALERNDAKAL